MSADDQRRWDKRYDELDPAPSDNYSIPSVLADFEHLFPRSGAALDVACGPGRAAVWLAKRGMEVWGVDVSSIAIGLARQNAEQGGVSDRCRFDVHDLDAGLPPGDPVDLVLCHLFRAPYIDQQMIDRLKPGGTLAAACLSEVGHGSGRFRAAPGELTRAFAGLHCQASGEADGHTWFIGTRL